MHNVRLQPRQAQPQHDTFPIKVLRLHAELMRLPNASTPFSYKLFTTS